MYARSAGLSDEEVERVAIGTVAPGWSAHDRALLSATDELHAGQQLSDAAWSALRAQSSDAQLVEIPLVVGHYTMLSMLANASFVPLDPGLPALPAGPGG